MKKLIQLFIFLILILVSLSFYFNFFKTNKSSDLNKIELKENSSLLESDNNLIKNLEYNVTFDNNTKYTITAELSELKYEDDTEIVEMQFVTAIFNDKDGIPLIITSKNASYNNLNYNTSFSNNVKVVYLSNLLLSEKLDINFNKNIIKIYENVVYEGLQGTVKADNVKLNLMTKNMEIFMQNKDEKIEVSSQE
ncbi:LPS export ABC transporter periplasmic protein LptC [Candidatus Pelagibacter sp.]|nr:LPS export ABC transporter periplasmic protein LptC [Candidatus Pelagibacter sp.]